MIDSINSLKSFVKFEEIQTDNNVFRLHYKFTVIMLIIFSILLTSKQYFGDPISCDLEKENQYRKEHVETFCWIYGTYLLTSTLEEGPLAGTGVDPINVPSLTQLYKHENTPGIITQKYYQWVCLAFAMQALCFYLPRYFWKACEAGRLRSLVKDLNGPLVSPQWTTDTKKQLLEYLLHGKYYHNMYAIQYLFCEMLNFINVLLQIFAIDWFLTREFSFYGIGALLQSPINLMDRVFPKVTKCRYYNYGASGSHQIIDALCILPLNILNEKLFLLLWFWLYMLAFLSFLALIYRMLFLSSLKVRLYILIAQTRFLCKKRATKIVQYLSFGDFFMLYRIGKNVNPTIYKEIVVGLHDYIYAKNLDQLLRNDIIV